MPCGGPGLCRRPLRHGEPITTGIWDVAADRPLRPAPITTAPGAIVVVDGIVLHRPELLQVWDASVWVEVPFEINTNVDAPILTRKR